MKKKIQDMLLNLIMTLKQVEGTITVILLSTNSISRLLYQQNLFLKPLTVHFLSRPLLSLVILLLLYSDFIPT